MGKTKTWEVSDKFWKKVEPLIPVPQRDPNKKYKCKVGVGRKPLPARQVFESIIYVFRTGCQWQALPKERFGNPVPFIPMDEREVSLSLDMTVAMSMTSIISTQWYTAR